MTNEEKRRSGIFSQERGSFGDHPFVDGSSLDGAIIPPSRGTIDNELRSLFALLDDPDERIAAAVTDRIKSRGPNVIESLLDHSRNTSDELTRIRIEQITTEFNTEILATEFEALALRLHRNDPSTLEDGSFLIARFGNPNCFVEGYKELLDDYASMLRTRIHGLTSSLEILHTCNNFFFEELRLRGNQGKFLEPENSYIDRVLDRKVGIPISLAIVYLLVTKHRLGLPFSGASAPGHFLIRYEGVPSEALFVDAFNAGVILRERDIKRYLDSSGFPFDRAFLAPAHPRAVLLRMIRNLIIVFTEQSMPASRKSFERFMHILSPNAEEGESFLRGLES